MLDESVPREGLHAWDLTPSEAAELQRTLRGQVQIFADDEPIPAPSGTEWVDGLPVLVAGVDASYDKFDSHSYAVVAVWHRLEKRVVEIVTAVGHADFPYVPGLLSFREAPLVLEAIRNLKSVPGAFMFDGQGIAHPRGLGIASHVGLWLGVPTVGCAKTKLYGSYHQPVLKRGTTADLKAPATRSQSAPPKVGAVLCTQDGVKPLFVSPGHLASHKFAVDLVMATGTKYRLPEPTRQADAETKRLRVAETAKRESADADANASDSAEPGDE